jgi:uncharacterized protein YicC (UPF0701 family)
MTDASWAGAGAAVGALITGFFAWVVQRVKAGSDIEVAVLAEWQKLNAALSQRVSALEKELGEVRRSHSTELEEMREKSEARAQEHRAEVAELRRLNDGLQRQIAQNSQSTASLLSRSPVTKDKSDGK